MTALNTTYTTVQTEQGSVSVEIQDGTITSLQSKGGTFDLKIANKLFKICDLDLSVKMSILETCKLTRIGGFRSVHWESSCNERGAQVPRYDRIYCTSCGLKIEVVQ